MSKRRLDRLEGSLGPTEAVLHWLAKAHAADALPAYVASLTGLPEAAQPFVAVPVQVADAVYASMRGQPTAHIEAATREAVGDTVFLLRLVTGLDVHVESVLRVESLRHTALVWWSRALGARRTKAPLPPDWHAGAAVLVGTVAGTEDARRAAEVRYLGGHDLLFPALATRWEALRMGAKALGGDGEEVVAIAEQGVGRVVRMARADGLEAARRYRAADAMADRVAATIVGEGADG